MNGSGVHPVRERERIVALDVLRGVAVLGILAMNIRSFAAPFTTYLNPTLMYDYSGLSRAAYWATALVFDTKMISIFSMLFGAGALIYAEKWTRLGERPSARLWHWRVFWLLVIGLIHGYLIWEGDILVVYALCGLTFLWWTRKLPAWGLLILGGVMLAIGGLLSFGHAIAFPDMPPESQAEQLAFWQPSREALEEQVAVYRNGYLGIVEHRAPFVLMGHTFLFVQFFLWRAGGMMVLGQGLMKLGVLTGARSARFYAMMALSGYLIGLPIVAFGLSRLDAAGYAAPQRFVLDLYNYFGSVAVALGHVGLVLLLVKTRARWFGPVAAAGRMAFTNYLMQSVICTTLFYGYGFGLFGRLDYAWQLVVVLGVWMLQLIVSPWWLARYQFGPAEWVWRWLTYRKRPPMRRVRAVDAGQAPSPGVM